MQGRAAAEIEVEESIGTVIKESRRLEGNLARKESCHCYSPEAMQYEGAEYSDGETPETALEKGADTQRIAEAMAAMPDVQKRRLLLYAEGRTLREIARTKQALMDTGISEDAITSGGKSLEKRVPLSAGWFQDHYT